ncbi:MAG: flagellar biosynthetic protein FliO [Magnetococcales bacterium]|nr:flagellar biosynthetic protein FliO [Magnetococcales bacterium]
MMRSGVVARIRFVLFVVVLAVVLGGGLPGVGGVAVTWAADKGTVVDDKGLPPSGKVASADLKGPADGKGGSLETTKAAQFADLLGDAPWKLAGALLVLIALALLVVRLGRRLRPQWRGNGPIFIEDGRNLAPGVGVRLIRVGARYWLIGVTKENVTLLAELAEEDLLEEELEEEEDGPVMEPSPKGRFVRNVGHEDEPMLVDRGLQR